MTDEQEKMFDENRNLVYGAIKKYVKCAGMYGINDFDDIVQIGNIGLCKAIISYDAEKSEFSTYAYKIIRNHIYNALRDAGDIKEGYESLDDEDCYEQASIDCDYDDDIVMKKGIDIIMKCGENYSGVAKKGAKAIYLSLMGYDCREIASIFGVSQNNITAWMTRARMKLQREPEMQKLLGKGVYA